MVLRSRLLSSTSLKEYTKERIRPTSVHDLLLEFDDCELGDGIRNMNDLHQHLLTFMSPSTKLHILIREGIDLTGSCSVLTRQFSKAHFLSS